MKRYSFFVAFSALLLTACGGSSESPNQAPTLSLASTVDAYEQTELSITGTASDSDGSIATFTWRVSSGESIELTNADSDTVTFTTPTITSDTSITLTLEVSDDDGAIASSSITVNVTAVNAEPEITLPPMNEANEKETVSIEATVSDSDGEIASYLWEVIGGEPIELRGAETSQVTFTLPRDGVRWYNGVKTNGHRQ